MDMPEAEDPSNPTNGGGGVGNYSNGDDATRDMVATLSDVKPSVREFDGKSESFEVPPSVLQQPQTYGYTIRREDSDP